MSNSFQPHAFTYLSLPDLPKIPDHFVQQGLQLIAEGQQEKQNLSTPYVDPGKKYARDRHGEYFSRDRKLVSESTGLETSPIFNTTYNMNQAWTDWVHENITSVFYESGIRVTDSYDTESKYYGPHTDGAKFKLFYLVDPGHEETTTVFYLEKDQPLVRNLRDEFDIQIANNLDDLTIIDEVRLPCNTWVLLNGYIMHGVHNCLPGRRIHFFINMPAERVVHSIRIQ
jgi:hypothetical protein